jgi:hypothetical protein
MRDGDNLAALQVAFGFLGIALMLLSTGHWALGVRIALGIATFVCFCASWKFQDKHRRRDKR